MKKILLATAAGASLLAATLVSVPAHADELPGNVSDLPTATSTPVATPEYKADFNWTIPANDGGDPFTSCNVQFLREDGSIALEAPYPTSLRTLSFPFSATEMTNEPVVPGATTLSINYTCSNEAGDTSAEQTLVSDVVPDVVPTAPAIVNVNPANSSTLDIAYGGSETLGLAPLQGYQVVVLNGERVITTAQTSVSLGDREVRRASVRGASRMTTASVSASSTNPDGTLKSTLTDLPTGLYTVQVSGYNAVGLSTSTTRTVLLQAAIKPGTLVVSPGKVQGLKASKITKSSATLSWKAPANKAAKTYTVLVVDNKGKTKTYNVGAKTTLKVTKLKKKAHYNVRIIAVGSQSTLTSTTAASFNTKKR